MTAQEELTLLEDAYAKLLSGGVQSYTYNGRSLTRLDFEFICKRIDQLRAAVSRSSNGIFGVASMRNPE